MINNKSLTWPSDPEFFVSPDQNKEANDRVIAF